jgi:hypothetical protein
MGKWTLESITVTNELLDQDKFGNYVRAEYLLKYVPASIGSFVDVPPLYWFEIITLVDHKARQWWVYEENQYARNPRSMTLSTWYGKYRLAYDNIAYNIGDGERQVSHSRLFDNNMQPVNGPQFSDRHATRRKKAEAVRAYLGKHGGYLRIVILDTPAISKASANDFYKERLLLFHCGVVGLDAHQWVKHEQYLVANSALPLAQWTRHCRPEWFSTLRIPTGYQKIPPPANVVENKSAATNVEEGDYF